jgi:hypothetical protein
LNRSFTLIVLTLGCLALGACKTGPRFSEKPIVSREEPAKVLLMPVDVILSEMTASGNLEVNALWSEQAKRNLKEGVRRHPVLEGLETADYEEPRIDAPEDVLLTDFLKLHEAVGSEIEAHTYKPSHQLPTKGETLDWTLGPLARQMREKTGARFALFFYISDSYAGPGRVALIMTMGLLFGVPVEGGTQAGFASLVDLETGDVVWFNPALSVRQET